MAPSVPYIRRGIFVLLIVFLIAVPCVTFAADFFGPIVPAVCHCDNQTVQGAANGATSVTSAPDYGCVLQVIANLIKFGATFGVILCVIWIAYAGFSLMVSGGSAEARSQGKTRLVNALVGILVILSAWLIVNFVMGILYNGSFGDWNGILAGSGSDTCIQAHTPVAITAGLVISNIKTAAPGTTSSYSSGGNPALAGGLCVANQSCTAGYLQGLGLTSGQAQALSCIAQTESSGNPTAVSKTGACGLFQVLAGHSSSNWFQSSLHTGSCSTATSCTNAACNAQTAVIMFNQSRYTPWTCPGCNNKASACIAKYDPGS